VQDVLGCEASDDILVTINRSVKVYFPNIFSPNNDGFNDIFNMYTGIGITSINEFRIFDRWGNQMYALFNIPPNNSGTEGWDGNYKGSPVDSGVYTYFAEVTLIDGEEVIVRGDVTLVR
jgi:gliding motility-associated-like protein